MTKGRTSGLAAFQLSASHVSSGKSLHHLQNPSAPSRLYSAVGDRRWTSSVRSGATTDRSQPCVAERSQQCVAKRSQRGVTERSQRCVAERSPTVVTERTQQRRQTKPPGIPNEANQPLPNEPNFRRRRCSGRRSQPRAFIFPCRLARCLNFSRTNPPDQNARKCSSFNSLAQRCLRSVHIAGEGSGPQ